MSFPKPEVPEQSDAYATEAAALATSRRGLGQLARLGYFAIGVVYASIGVLAMLGVLGVGGGQYTGSFGAVRTLQAQPYGRVILAIIAAGLATYVSWRLAQSVFDVEDRGTDTSGLLRRGGLLMSALAYTILIVRIIFRMVIGSREDIEVGDWTEPIMNSPAGLVLIGLAGLAILGVAAMQFWSAYNAGFLDQIDASGRSRRSVSALGRFGFFSRGVVFGIVAFFLIISAIQTNTGSAKGLGGALQTLGEQPHGRFLIGLVAVGLFSYGLFMLTKARFRHLAPEEEDGQEDRDETDA